MTRPPATPLLEVEDLDRRLPPPRRGPVVANDRVRSRVRPRRDARHRRRDRAAASRCSAAPSCACCPRRRRRSRPGACRSQGRDLLALDERRRCARCAGADIAMIFQNPMTSLDPVRPIGDQIAEPLRLHRGLARPGGAAAGGRAAATGSASPRPRAPRRRLSASMVGRHAAARGDRHGDGRQRRSCSWPTSRPPRSTSPSRTRSSRCCCRSPARDRHGAGPGLARHGRHRRDLPTGVAVMYAGRIVETGDDRARSSSAPAHPYSRGPARLDPARSSDARAAGCRTIPGQPPDLPRLAAGLRLRRRAARWRRADCRRTSRRRARSAGHASSAATRSGCRCRPRRVA